MVQNPYYPSEAEQDAALTEYDRVQEALDYLDEAHKNGELTYPFYTGLHDLISSICDQRDDIMKYRVTVPTGQTKTTTNSRNQLVGVPDLGESEHYLMTEGELNQWFESWKADGATGPFVIIEQLAR